MIALRIRHYAVVCMISVAAGLAQTPDLHELQNKLVQFEESTQKTIQELRAQVAALEQAQKSQQAAASVVATASSPVPTVEVPVEYYGTRNEDQGNGRAK